MDSKLEIEIKADSLYYSYGVIFNIRGIKKEWLYQISSRAKKKIFERIQEVDYVNYFFGEIEGNEESKQFVKFLSEGTPIDKSFLSEYHKRNGKGIIAISNVYNWFDDNLKIIFPETRFRGLSFRLEKDDEFSNVTKRLLHFFNTGISDLKKVATNKEETDLPKKLISQILSEAKPDENCCVASSDQQSVYFFETDKEGQTKIYKQMTVHKNSQDEDVVFDMDEESDGSIRLLDFIPMLIDLQFNSAVYLIDEIIRRRIYVKYLAVFTNGLIKNEDIKTAFERFIRYAYSIERETEILEEKFGIDYRSNYNFNGERVTVIISSCNHPIKKEFLNNTAKFYNYGMNKDDFLCFVQEDNSDDIVYIVSGKFKENYEHILQDKQAVLMRSVRN